ncbi:MAG: membrane fusion protein [Verrucomicrobia bacterium]|nr:MAG: membrane fusion protein [Verrucomicrobiota bacterium]
MKPFHLLCLFLTFTLGLTAATAAVYQCPMHPWIKSDHPGDKCTICGMDLVAAAPGDIAVDPNLVVLSPAAAAVVNVRTSEVHRGALVHTLRVAGVIEDDDTRHHILTARVPGRIEKLFVNYVGAEVHEGEPLATVYSPEMLTAQRQYVERLKGGAAFPASDRAAARERLLNMGLTEEEVIVLEHTQEPSAFLTIRAPMTGTVTARHVYEGQQINQDPAESASRLFEVGDFSKMWFVFDAYETDLAWLRVGQTVAVTTASQPGRIFTAPIAFIDPNLNEATRTARVRVVLENPDRALLHKLTAYGAVSAGSPDVLLVPRSAVLRHSGSPVVFVDRGKGSYAARNVQLGRMGDMDAEVIAGLAAGDRVVTEGGLLLDGQAQLAHAAVGGDDASSPVTPVVTNAAPTPLDAHAYGLLKALAFASADAATSLANDDLPGYQQALPAVRAALTAYLDGYKPASRTPLAESQDALVNGPDLRTARRAFEVFSTALADTAREHGLPAREQLHVMQCPMSPVLGVGRWLQRDAKVHNPFFGSAMPSCGDEVK